MLMQSNSSFQAPLTKEELMKKSPTVFEQSPTMKLSNKYVHIPTSKVIEDLEKLGWFPVDALQRNSRKKESSRFSKHMVKFQNPELKIIGKDGDDAFPQIILTNSHDGLSSFKFMIGIYRLVCSNGLVVADEEFSNFKIRHMGYSFEELQQMVKQAVADLPTKVEVINKMKLSILSQEAQRDLALKAFLLRQGINISSGDLKEYRTEVGTLEEILEPRRIQDQGDDAWTVFNRVQEAMIKGGFKGALEGGKVRKIRKITSFEKDLKLNQELFKLVTTLI
jgi:hypothetical protein